ncbi:hypothetical protein [Burkholderia anthinoferrum]|uniref:hypothetical protein n=1 Tax=Burkholderia anthinoferrum TaxID=3090833 RepID=UPI0011B0BC49|nr:hypothetical protein [Burkholderia anthinoferrum]
MAQPHHLADRGCGRVQFGCVAAELGAPGKILDPPYVAGRRRLILMDNSISALTAHRQLTRTISTSMQEATTGDGRPAPPSYAPLLLATERGYVRELRDTRRIKPVEHAAGAALRGPAVAER